eukprot:m.201681 g.201681  ORF g.201681 m.201681 type:complete len:431 (+) comp32804_c3_seq6:267-1559(+)
MADKTPSPNKQAQVTLLLQNPDGADYIEGPLGRSTSYRVGVSETETETDDLETEDCEPNDEDDTTSLVRKNNTLDEYGHAATFTAFMKSTSRINRSRKSSNYYNTQTAVIESFREADRLIENSENDTELNHAAGDKYAFRTALAVNLSLITNLLLFIIKIVAVSLTGSLAVLSSLVDSALDLFSGIVIWGTNRYMRKNNRYLYPVGKARFEPVATIIIAAVMATAAIQLCSSAIQVIADNSADVTISAVSLSLIGSTVLFKLLLYLLCRSVKGSSSASALATDHLNDIVNNSVTMLTAWIGAEYWPNADPVGAIFIGIIIIVNWYREGREHVAKLAGRGASPQFIQKVTWVAMNHDVRVQLVDTVRAIHCGTNFWVEVDIVLPPEMPLHEAHDIGEALQHKLELLPEVDRAHVHLDYEIDHNEDDEHKRL